MLISTTHTRPLIIGHRGASHDAPENTLEAFRLAWEQGADGIEADFRLTADGRIVCMHDEVTTRTTGVALKVADTQLESLQRLDAGSFKGADWSGAVIPTLDEILSEMPYDSWFFIELKCGPEIIVPLEQLLLSSGHSPERIRLLSFSLPLITMIRQRLPKWYACWNSDYKYNILNNIWRPSQTEVLVALQSSVADGLSSADRTILDQKLVDALREQGKEIHVWTVDRLDAAERLRHLGVNSIMTNRPGWLRKQMAEVQTP
ncbi:MAG: glycerophosphodiester phosphodiesterase [Geobacteraceae bacterium]|nr:glycerophosphodiester phosphodiesterase [Geobacteraceae bacterium]